MAVLYHPVSPIIHHNADAGVSECQRNISKLSFYCSKSFPTFPLTDYHCIFLYKLYTELARSSARDWSMILEIIFVFEEKKIICKT